MINDHRLGDLFMELVRIDSVSRSEGAVADHLQRRLSHLGARVVRDDSGARTGSETGNLVAFFDGGSDVEPMLLNAHMDTVEPGKNIRPKLRDGVFTSDGTTILGADDKSALAIILEVLTVLRENNIGHGPLEVVFTVCEEIGLVGAKHLDYSLLSSRYGYALDTTGTDHIVTRAPSANKIEFVVYGKDAHAGVAPENGVNAIQLAARALAKIEIGRIDKETTCNIGLIEGGVATNIVPSRVTVRGEARSHDEEKLEAVTRAMERGFQDAVNEAREEFRGRFELPPAEVRVEKDFGLIDIPDTHPVVRLAMDAADRLGRDLALHQSGGGADANIFFANGIACGILGTGMRDMHTVRESVALSDMVKSAELLLEIVKLHAGKGTGPTG
ncbi:MAG: M20/M25/M40 family metallo-hydrolase [Desulfatibacillaceae bacterium]